MRPSNASPALLRPARRARAGVVPTSARGARAPAPPTSSRSRARRSLFTSSETSSASLSAGVSGRGEYLNAKSDTKPTSRTSESVCREVVLGLAGEADDDVRRQRQPRARAREALDALDVLCTRVAADHPLRACDRFPIAPAGARGARARRARRGRARATPSLARVRARVAEAREARAPRAAMSAEEVRELRLVGVVGARVGGGAARRRSRKLSTVCPSKRSPRATRAPPSARISATISRARPVALGTARVRHDAEGAALVAALHRRDERGSTGARRRSGRAGEEARGVDVERRCARAAASPRAALERARAARRCCRARRRGRCAGTRSRSFSPSCWATHPATAMTSSGRARFFSGASFPTSLRSFCSAFSRTLHVLKTTRSASSERRLGVQPCAPQDLGHAVGVVDVHLAAERRDDEA